MSYEIIRLDLNGVNGYLVKTEQGFILFDTGGHMFRDETFTDRRELLVRELEARGCTEQDLKLIVLTHGDSDHTGNAAYLKKRYNAPVAIHGGDREVVEKPILEQWLSNVSYSSVIHKLIFLLLRKKIEKLTQKTLEDFQPFTPDVLLEEGFSLQPFGLDAQIIHLPGHTKGSIGVLTKDGDFISGDILSNNGKPGIAPNASDFKKMHASLKRLSGMPVGTVYPGHGAPFPFSGLKRSLLG